LVDVLLPKMGMQTVEVDVIKVCVQVGDRVEVGDPIVEVESEKAEMVINAEHAGTVAELLVAEGDVVEPGHVLARLNPE